MHKNGYSVAKHMMNCWYKHLIDIGSKCIFTLFFSLHIIFITLRVINPHIVFLNELEHPDITLFLMLCAYL